MSKLKAKKLKKPPKKWYPKKRKKKSKYKRPKVGHTSIVPLGQVGPAGLMKYHKGYVYDRIRHTVLTITQMSDKDKHFVQATLKTIVTGPQAMTLPDGENGWRCEALDMLGKAYILSYRGMEVALFYKRQLTEVKLESGDRFPEGVCQDPNDAWQRLDILGLSAKKANLVITAQHTRLNQELNLNIQRASTQQDLIDALEKENKRLKEAQQAMLKKLPKKRKR